MKQQTPTLRRAAALLLAAAALPLTPLLAQETTAPAQAPAPPVVDVTPPPALPAAPPEAAPPAATTDPAPVVAPAPARVTPPSAARTSRAAPHAAPRAQIARQIARTSTARPRATAQPPRQAPAATPAPIAAAPVAEAPAAAPVAASTPAPVAEAPPAATPATTPAPAGGRSILPWLLAGLLVAGLAAFFLLRRRRDETEIYEDTRLAPVAAPAMTAPVVPVAAVAPADVGRPWIELMMRPVRAGVNEDDAVVEFELTVDNQGSAAARDVRISTWMFAAGASEMEQSLIQRPDTGASAAVTIGSGDNRRIKSAVALPTAGIEEDSVLPVVVAEARYTLPDGSEGRTSASFEVGVPYDGELAHFAIDNPSGLHEDVEARAHGEAEMV